jgi:hypothetical protein
MEVVGRSHVDDIHGRIVEELVQGRIAPSDAQCLGPDPAPLRRTAENAAHLDADPAERLDVNRTDEARTDDGRADLGDPLHALFTHLLA